VAAVGLAVVMIFIIQNALAVNVSFLGAHLRRSLAVALQLAAIAGALLMAAAGTARITQPACSPRSLSRTHRRRGWPGRPGEAGAGGHGRGLSEAGH